MEEININLDSVPHPAPVSVDLNSVGKFNGDINVMSDSSEPFAPSYLLTTEKKKKVLLHQVL